MAPTRYPTAYPVAVVLCIVTMMAAGGESRAAPARVISGRYIDVRIHGSDCIVTDSPYLAVGDGKHNDTAAIQMALDDSRCGRVVVPGKTEEKETEEKETEETETETETETSSTFLIAALRISRDNTELHISEGATLLVSDDRGRWPGGQHVISARGVKHVAVSGGGTVDGQGLEWWRHAQNHTFRPHMVDFSHVVTAILSDTLYLNAPNHVLELGCDHCELARVRVLSPPSTGACKATNTCS